MLIEFSVENHRAFREKQTFTMVASGTAERAGHGLVLKTGFSVVPLVLSEACIFGANGSGKSSFIDAMRFMSSFVKNSFQQKNSQVQVTSPFKFHSKWRRRPSEFEVIFVHKETLFQYGFVLNRERVLEEWLFARSSVTQRERQLFSRTYNQESDTYIWELNPEHLRGKRESWREATRPDALFLTTAAHMNAETLQAPYEWVTELLQFVELEQMQSVQIPGQYLKEDEWKHRILQFMKDADLDLSDFHTREREFSKEEHDFKKYISEKFNLNESDSEGYRRPIEVFTTRKDDEGSEISLSMREESSGTLALLNLAGPILETLDRGLVLFVDELNSGLHPLAFQHLAGLFTDPKSNPKAAQLIFTTHDTSVADQECMGRDQIWLVEKNNEFAAKLVPLSDFKVRDAKGFQKKYLDGRFGGVPIVAN